MRYYLIGMLLALPPHILADQVDQLNFSDFTDSRDSLSFFQGAQPISYVVTLQLPLLDNHQRGYITKGSVSITFRWTPNSGIFQVQRLLAVHTKEIGIRQDSVHLWQLQHLTGVQQVQLTIKEVKNVEGEEITVVRLADQDQLENGEIYRLDIGEFIGRVQDEGSGNGIFLTSPGLATQFQLNDARRAFPCLDTPSKKAVFTFTLIHRSSYIALFNTDMNVQASELVDNADGWTKTRFHQTPIMSTYVVAFTLIPKTFIERGSLTTRTPSGVRISIFYNPERLTDTRRPSSLLKFASTVYGSLQKTFSPRLPLTKLDVSIVKGLSILGMENWGLVNLKEEFVVKENQVEQFGLLAHEFVHQWIGDLATTADWKHLCVQEGLTEHYARRTLADYYGGTNSQQYQRYIFIRYLPAIQNETNNVHLKPIRQNFQGFDEAVAYCFGRVPFIWTMIERIVGGRVFFDEMINRFLADFSYKSFVLDDLLSYLDLSGDILRFYVDHGGYASLFVTRLNDSMFHFHQRQIVPLQSDDPQSGATFEVPSIKDPWPIPLTTLHGLKVMRTNDMDMSVDQMPFDDHNVPVINLDFAYFYRVNYEADVWQSIADALLSFPQNYTEVTRAQFLTDFCFFRGLNLIHQPVNGHEDLNALTQRFRQVQSQLELSTNVFVRFFTKGC